MYTYTLYYAICTLYNAIYRIKSSLIIHICYPRCYVKPFLDIRAMVRIMTLFLVPLFSYVYLYLYYTHNYLYHSYYTCPYFSPLFLTPTFLTPTPLTPTLLTPIFLTPTISHPYFYTPTIPLVGPFL